MRKLWLLLIVLGSCTAPEKKIEKVILISANAEWKAIKLIYPNEIIQHSPWGEYFEKDLPVGTTTDHVIFFHGGWGKVAAAGSTQYCIDHWQPKYLINIGTCGGFEGHLAKGDVVLVEKTIIYDIVEAMGDSKQAIKDYSSTLDLSWLEEELPRPVKRSLMVSADRDLIPEEIPKLHEQYNAVAGDWETGAIAYTCARNKQRVLILRGVSDVVSIKTGSEAYGNEGAFVASADTIMRQLVEDLPAWLEKCK